MNFIKFPNGRVWPVDDNGHIKGTVLVPEAGTTRNLEQFLDKLSEAATGCSAGLTDYWYENRGGEFYAFAGFASGAPDFSDAEADLDDHVLLDPDNKPDHLTILRNTWMLQYDLSEVEVAHALAHRHDVNDPDPKEIALPVLGSAREFRLPAHPEPCSQVRVVVDGFEVARWNADEWADDPAEVMGALLGVAGKGAMRQTVN
jgi:hypothetical protein